MFFLPYSVDIFLSFGMFWNHVEHLLCAGVKAGFMISVERVYTMRLRELHDLATVMRSEAGELGNGCWLI